MVYHAIVEVLVCLEVDRPLHDTIPEAQSHDEPFLRFMDVELPVPAHFVGVPDQVVLYADQVFLQIRREGGHVVAVPLLACCLVVCVQKILPRVYSLQKGGLVSWIHVLVPPCVVIIMARVVTFLGEIFPLRSPRRRIRIPLLPA